MVVDFRLNSSRLVSLWVPWRKEAEKQHAMHAWPEDGCPREKTCLILAWSIYRITTFKLRKHTRCWEYIRAWYTRSWNVRSISTLELWQWKREVSSWCACFSQNHDEVFYFQFSSLYVGMTLTALNEKEKVHQHDLSQDWRRAEELAHLCCRASCNGSHMVDWGQSQCQWKWISN